MVVIALYLTGDKATSINYNNSKNINYPTVAGSEGGVSVNGQFNTTFSTFINPCYFLVNPEKKAVEKNVYPAGNTLLSILENYPILKTGISESFLSKHVNSDNISILNNFIKIGNNASVNINILQDGLYNFNTFLPNGKKMGNFNLFLNMGRQTIALNTFINSDGNVLYITKIIKVK